MRIRARLQLRHYFTPARRRVSLTREIAHPRVAVFAVVADVERYSEFVPFCRTSAIVHRRSRDNFDANLSLGFLAFVEDYVSHVRLDRPSSITATASNTPLFEQLDSRWRFEDGATPGTCQLHFEMTMLLRSIFHDQALARVIDGVVAEQVAAFCRRCDELIQAGDDDDAGSPPSSGPQLGGKAYSHAATIPSSPTVPDAIAAAADTNVFALRPEPAWRQQVDAAFDAHSVDGSLSLVRFVEVCRALGPLVPPLVPPRVPPLMPHATKAAADGKLSAGQRLPPDRLPPKATTAEAHTTMSTSSPTARSPRSTMSRSRARALADLGDLVLAAWFVEFDEDANGSVEREEFSRNLWLLTRASDEQARANTCICTCICTDTYTGMALSTVTSAAA